MGGRWQQSGGSDGLGHRIGIAQRPQLNAAAGGEFQCSAAVFGGEESQHPELCRSDDPARQPHPRQRAVGGLVQLQCAGAGVLVAGSGHPTTVRRCLRGATQAGRG